MVPNILRVWPPRYLFLSWAFCCIVLSRVVFWLSRDTFFIFHFISTCLMVSASKMPTYLYVCFSSSVLLFSWFGSSIPSARCRLPLFITSMAYFPMPNSISMSWLYILTACIIASSSFLIFCKQFDVVHVH